MSVEAQCTRCGRAVRPPGLMSSQWRCEHCGVVDPLYVMAPVAGRVVAAIAAQAQVPLWLLSPAPVGWTLSGLARAGDERTGTRAIAVAWTGPSPLGGLAECLVIAEEPGIGLGARYAGLSGLDPGDSVRGAPDAKVEMQGHPTALWSCPSDDDRAVLVGEAEGAWLWLVLSPAPAETLLFEHLVFVDARERMVPVELGAASTQLTRW